MVVEYLQKPLLVEFFHSPFHKKLTCLLVSPYSGSKENLKLDFPSGPVVKTLPYGAGAVGSIPGLEMKILHTTAKEPTCRSQKGKKKKKRLRIVWEKKKKKRQNCSVLWLQLLSPHSPLFWIFAHHSSDLSHAMRLFFHKNVFICLFLFPFCILFFFWVPLSNRLPQPQKWPHFLIFQS